MSRAKGEFYDLRDLEIYHPKQNQISVTLPVSIISIILRSIDENIERLFEDLKSKPDELVYLWSDGRKVTLHKDIRSQIFDRLCVLEYILKLDHYQEIYNHSWDFHYDEEFQGDDWIKKGQKKLGERKSSVPVEGSDEELHSRFLSIEDILETLVVNDGVLTYPTEVRRFCDKYVSELEDQYT